MITVEADLIEPTMDWVRSAGDVVRVWSEMEIPSPLSRDWSNDVTSEVRADIAAVAVTPERTELWAWEIKSGSDTLTRLENQASLYGTVANRCGLVCDRKHLARAVGLLPAWWAVVVADGVDLTEVRRGMPSPDVDPTRLVRFLWADEARLAARWWAAAVTAKSSRRVAWERLVAAASPEAIAGLAHTALASAPDARPVTAGFGAVHHRFHGGDPVGPVGDVDRGPRPGPPPEPVDQLGLFG